MTHVKLQKLKKSDYPPAHRLNGNVLLSNITFLLLTAVNSCLNCSFLHLYLQFYNISVAATWYRATRYGVRNHHNFWDTSAAKPAPTKFGTKVVIVTYSPNPSCVPNLKLLASTVAQISWGPKLQKGDYPPAHRLSGNVLLSNITFL